MNHCHPTDSQVSSSETSTLCIDSHSGEPILVKKKKKLQVILSALRPLTCNSMWPQHTLQ